MLPSVRRDDVHTCPHHGASPVTGPCCPTVLIGNQPAARKGDSALCLDTTPDPIVDGCPTVLIGNQPAARLAERCAHGGVVTGGFARVLIGHPPVDADGRVIPIPPECTFLKDFGHKATGRRLGRLRDQYDLSPPTQVWEEVPDDTSVTAFDAREVTIRGHKVTIHEPVYGPPPDKWLPTADSVAKGLATLSDEQLQALDRVFIVPHPCTVGRRNTVADYSGGTIRYFPRNEPHPQSDIDWALQHESGHAFSLDVAWAKDPGAKDAWQKAMDADRRSVSEYGDTNLLEDFAEFMIVFSSTRGTPCEASARALFPHRYREMDRLFPRGVVERDVSAANETY
ncbi:hypothetical protein GF068_36970 [Polyangium spumosum]|uniref:Uncharacterized protein n=1 Tax=Polyangium spumosum TaxID=889282 RepID=A0A6N7Q9B9_9BACT|nr:PAAR domain-containing protein [Polyangium spumosum]MRG97481.1 hypothetical protein [Polyangium spumosum]